MNDNYLDFIVACETGDLDKVENLINKIDINFQYKNEDGKTPLMYSSKKMVIYTFPNS